MNGAPMTLYCAKVVRTIWEFESGRMAPTIIG